MRTLLAIIFLCITGTPAWAIPDFPTFHLSTPSPTVMLGEAFDVTLGLVPPQNVSNINYHHMVVSENTKTRATRVTNLAPGSLLADGFPTEPFFLRPALSFTRLYQQGVAIATTNFLELVTITYDAIGTGLTTFQLSPPFWDEPTSMNFDVGCDARGCAGFQPLADRTVTVNIVDGGQPVPEPGTIVLLATGLLGLGVWRFHRTMWP